MNKLNIHPDKIRAWIERNFSGQFKVRPNGTEYVINNPLNGDSGYHFNISLIKGVCHDWRGDSWAGPPAPGKKNRSCTFLKFVRLYKKCSYRDALRDVLGASADLKGFLNISGRIDSEVPDVDIAVTLPSTAEPLLPNSTDKQAQMLVTWLHKRGYTDEEIQDDDLYYSGMDVYWPYYEFDQLVYWQSRSFLNKRFNFPSINVRDESGKIIGKTEGSKGDYLYGFDNIEPAQFLAVTEAIFDKTMLGKQCAASGGAILTERQVSKIKMLGPKGGIILAPDNDAAGLKSVLSNAVILEPLGYKLYCSIPKQIEYVKDGVKGVTKDFNEMFTHAKMSRKEILASFESAIVKLDFNCRFKIRAIVSDMEKGKK